MSSRLPYGIHAQSGAACFKREVEQSLAPWREMIARDDARVVRSIHCPQVPNAVDGFSPIVLYQIALRDTGKVVQVSIQGKHDPLPNPVSAWNETRAQGRKRKGATAAASTAAVGDGRGSQRNRTSSSEGKMTAAKRRLQMSNEEYCEAHEAEGQHCYGENTEAEYDDGLAIRQRKRVALQENCQASDDAYRHEGDQQAYDEYGYDDVGAANEEEIPANVIAHVAFHPPTPQKKPSKPSSRQPGPPRYSLRRSTSLAAQGLAPLYGLDDLREPDGSIRYFPSTAANSEAAESCSGETMDSHATYTPQSQQQQRGVRRSSRLASLAPGSLDEDVRHHEEQVRATAHRLAEVGLLPPTEEAEEDGEQEDVDMSSMILDYEDEEEARLAREQMRREGQRRNLTEQEVDDEMMSLDRWVKAEES